MGTKTRLILFLAMFFSLLFLVNTGIAMGEYSRSRNIEGYVLEVCLSPHFSDDGLGFAVRGQEKVWDKRYTDLYRTTDGGKTWNKLKLKIAYHDLSWSEAEDLFISGLTIRENGRVLLFITRTRVDDQFPFDSDEYKLGLKSYDQGDTWEIDGDLDSDIKEFGNGVMINTDDKEIEITLDGGDTWKEIDLEINPRPIGKEFSIENKFAIKGDILAISAPNDIAGLYISSDAGNTLRKVNQKQFEYKPKTVASSIFCVSVSSDGYVFAGTKEGRILYSKDDFKTWQPLIDNLSDVFDIENYASNGTHIILAATEYGLFTIDSKIPVQEKILIKFTIGTRSYLSNGNEMQIDGEPFLENGRAYVPLRYLANALGVSDEGIKWDEKNQTVTLTQDNISIIMKVGSNRLIINGKDEEIDVSPLMWKDRTYLPARYVAEAFGYSVGWDETTQIVSLQK